MNHNKFFTFGIVLAFAIILSGCGSPAAPAATPEPLVCPTAVPQSCPEAELQPPVLNAWRWDYSGNANYIITFEPGDKCTMEAVIPMEGKTISYEIVVNDQTYQNYMVVALALEEGMDIKDLNAYTAEGGDHNLQPPSWSEIQVLDVVSPLSRTWHGLPPTEDLLYFTCLVQGPDEQKVIQHFDGIKPPGN